jgi:hypothetical protein
MQTLQRQHQAEMMEFQERSIGLQAYSASLQKLAAETQKQIMDDWVDKLELAEETNSYDPASGNIGALNKLVVEGFGRANKANIDSVTNMLRGLNSQLPGAEKIAEVIGAINGVSTWKIEYLLSFLRTLR